MSLTKYGIPLTRGRKVGGTRQHEAIEYRHRLSVALARDL